MLARRGALGRLSHHAGSLVAGADSAGGPRSTPARHRGAAAPAGGGIHWRHWGDGSVTDLALGVAMSYRSPRCERSHQLNRIRSTTTCTFTSPGNQLPVRRE